MIFNLELHQASKNWNKYYYEIEAESLEEAIELIKTDAVSPYDSKEINIEYFFNEMEIFDGSDNLVYSNIE